MPRSPAIFSVRSDVERLLPQLLPHGKPNTSEVARRLGLSGRTLSRSLHVEGVTDTEIIKELRGAIARRYLRDRELPISEIVWAIGVSGDQPVHARFQTMDAVDPEGIPIDHPQLMVHAVKAQVHCT